jgi:hypothetical protein
MNRILDVGPGAVPERADGVVEGDDQFAVVLEGDGASSSNTSTLVAVWLVVGLQVGVLLLMVAFHSTQSQSPLTW